MVAAAAAAAAAVAAAAVVVVVDTVGKSCSLTVPAAQVLAV